MDERDGVECPEQQQSQHRQSFVKKTKSEIKQDKKMSKTESRFKSKLESLKRFQHSASTNSAVEKARAFFRSLELKHLGGGGSSSSEHSSVSSSRRRTTKKKNSDGNPPVIPQTSSMSSSSSSSIIDDSHQTISTTTIHPSSFPNSHPTNCIATARIIRVINPKDVIVHRSMESNPDDSPSSSSYLTMPKASSSKTMSMPKHYQTYSVSSGKSRDMQTQYDTRPLSSSSLFNTNVMYTPPRQYSSLTNGNLSNHPMVSSLYNYRPLVCRQMESPSSSVMSSSFHEQSDRLMDPIIRPLPSSSSMSTWTQSVRRLNTEYTSTINALQQAKESLKQTYPEPTDSISKYASFVARGISDLANNNETKKTHGVTFCLTAPISQESLSISSSASSQLSKNSIQQCKTPPMNTFSKPKLVRPLELDTFIPSITSLPKLEVISLPATETNEKIDSIANIIKKFNNLNHSPSSSENNHHPISPQLKKEQSDIKPMGSHSSPRVHFKSSVTTYELEDIPYESPPPPLSSSSSSSLASEDSTSSTSTSGEDPADNRCENPIQEETTYTVETFYHRNSIINNPIPSNHQQVVVIRENTTEEQFNSAREINKDEKDFPQQILTESKLSMNQTNIPSIPTPLFTCLKQIPPNLEKQENLHNKNYHSVESPSLHIRNKFISSDIYHDEDDETINDVVTINPYTQSPPLHRLASISSTSSSSDTASSAATVLLTTKVTSVRPIIPTPSTTTKNNPSISQLPRRTLTNNSRLKQTPEKVSLSSKLKPPSSTSSKPIKSMIANSTSSTVATTSSSSTTSPMRKPTGITNQSSTTMTSNSVNKTIQQQSSSSSTTAKKQQHQQQLVNGTNMTESQNSTDSPISLGKNRVRSMVNQLNAAVSTTTSTNPTKRIPVATTSTINTRRPGSTETTNKTSITSTSRPSLQRAMTMNNQSPVTPSPPSTPPTMSNNSSTYKRKAPLIRSTSNVKEGLLRWCQAQVIGYPKVSITNLSSSWSDGLAFCALIHHFFPDAFDFNSLSPTNRKENFELAFHTAEERADVPRLLDVSDMLLMGNNPDYKCIFTYLNSFLAKVKDLHPTHNGVERH